MPGNAAFAAAIASRTSSRVESGAVFDDFVQYSPDCAVRVACPERDSTQRPLMKLRHSDAVAVASLIECLLYSPVRQSAACVEPLASVRAISP